MFLIVLIVLSFIIVRPFIISILTSLILAYIGTPLYKKIRKKIKNRNISALITTIILILLILIPSFLILQTLLKEAYIIYPSIKETISSGDFFPDKCLQNSGDFSCKIAGTIEGFLSNPQTRLYLDNAITGISNYLIKHISNFFISLPLFILNSFIVVFSVFFVFRDGPVLLEKVSKLLPLRKQHKEQVFTKFKDVAFAVIYGSIIVAIVQGIVGAIGFFFVGIKGPIFWGIMMMFLALLPFLGTSIVWFPASMGLILTGYISSDSGLLIKGIILLIYGTFVISLVDNFLKPKIIGDRGGVHPVLVLLGVFGGIQILGFIGIVVGPLLLALLVAFIKIYEDEKFTSH